MPKRKQKKSFKDRIANSSKRQQKESKSFGYISLPDGVSLFKEEPKTIAALDIIPYPVTDENHPDSGDILDNLWYRRPFLRHTNIGVNDEMIVCPKTFGKRCPICEYEKQKAKQGVSKEELETYKAKKRNLYVIIPKMDQMKKGTYKDYEEKPYIWDISDWFFQNLLNEEIEVDESLGAFLDLEDGLTLKIRFAAGKFEKTTFAKPARIDFEEREDNYNEDFPNDMPKLDEVLNVLSFAELEKKFFEMEDEESEDDNGLANDPEDTPKEPEDEPEDTNGDKPEDEPNEDTCTACRGSGKNSKGKKCKSCKGTGEKQEHQKDKKGEKEEKRRQRKRGNADKDEDNKCPHRHEFGTDVDEKDECKDCTEWDDCFDAKE